MKLTRKLVIVGVLFSIIPIGLGIVALTTQSWINLNTNNSTLNSYGLFDCANSNTQCLVAPESTTVQGLLIAGVAAIGFGVIISILLEIMFKNQKIQLIRLIFLFAGPTLIFIGLLFYAKYLFEAIREGANTLDLDYSIILMIVTCIVGYLTAVYFAFVSGLGINTRRDRIGHSNVQTVVTQYSERF